MKRRVTANPEQEQQTNRTLTVDIPTEFVPLPTKGKIYGSESNLHDLEELEIRVMTARDEDILTSPALIRKGIALDRLLQNIIVDKSINLDELIRGDRDAILIALRITGYGAEYNTKITCPDCGDNFENKFDLSGLDIKTLDIEPISEYSNRFHFVLPVTKKEVIWRFLTGVDERDITNTIARKKKNVTGQSNDNLVTLKLIHSIVAVDGISDKGQIAGFIRNMPARDSLALRSHIDDNEPKILMNNSIECPECGEESEVAIPMALQFFWPNLRT